MAYNLNVADVSIGSISDNTVIAAVTGRRIRVYKIILEDTDQTNDVDVVFKDGSTAFNATAFHIVSNGYLEQGDLASDNWVYESSAQSAAFVVNLSAAVAVTGRIWYSTI